MFTGIVEEQGTLHSIQRGAKSSMLTIQGKLIFGDLKIGDSVAVNGICLTATSCAGNTFTADAVHETLNRSSLNRLKAGAHVNLERAMSANGRFGGHFVAGHVDGTGVIVGIEKDDNAIWFTVKAEPSLMKYIVEKGSVAIDGISLTVAEVFDESFRVSVIPHTVKATTLSERAVGDIVNLENDIVGKYVEKLMGFEQAPKAQSGLTKDFLIKFGY